MSEHAPYGTEARDDAIASAADIAEGSAVARQLVARVSADLRERAGGWRDAPADAVDALCAHLVADDPRAAEAHISALLARGVAADRLYSGYLAGAARELGRRWEDDEISFGEVGLGMARLQRLLRELSPAFLGGAHAPGGLDAPCAIVASAPGERHVFGALMFADHLRRIGWRVRLEVGGDEAPILAACEDEAADVVAVSIACRVCLPRVRTLVGALRAARTPPRLIALGGALADFGAEDLAACGADLTARTAAEVQSALAEAPARTTRV
ncbi:MAG: cobalamin B12-binding domain-containing protein [Pseudomonadota bacterium]